MAYRRQILIERTSEPAIVIRQIELPQRPISHLNLTFILDMTAVQTAYELNNTLNAAFNEITVFQSGACIIKLESLQMIWLSALAWGRTPWHTTNSGDNLTARVGVSLQIPFGRRLYDPKECLPRRPFGDTIFRYDLPGLTGNMTTRTVQIEVVELPEAEPERHIKYEQLELNNPTVNFDNRVTLPRRHPILGILFAPTSQHKLAGSANNIERYRIQADDQDLVIRRGDWFSLWHETKYRTALRWMDSHELIENIAAAYTQNAESRNVRAIAQRAGTQAGRKAYLDFDPLGDGQHALDGKDFGELELIIDAGTTDNIAFVPVELVELGP